MFTQNGKNAASGFRFLKSEDASAARLRRRTLSCKAGQRLHDTVIVALACFALVSQWTAYAVEIPSDCIYLVKSDSGKWYTSLTTDATHSNWAGGVKKGEGNYYVPEGMTAQADGTEQTVIGTIYCAGRVTSRGSVSEPVTFDDLRLLEGGDLYHSLVCQKRGNINRQVLQVASRNKRRIDTCEHDDQRDCTDQASVLFYKL